MLLSSKARLFFASILLASSVFAQNNNIKKPDIKFNHINRELSNNQVFTIHQDRTGFFWVGTLGGLHRFRGDEYDLFVTSKDTALLRAYPHLALRADLHAEPISWHVHDDPTWRPPVGSHIFGSVDYGYGAPWSFHLHAALPGGHVRTFFEDYGPRKRDVKQAEIIKKAADAWRRGRLTSGVKRALSAYFWLRR